MYRIFILYLILTFIIHIEAQTCTSDFDCPSTLYCPIYPPGTSPPIIRTCRSPQLSGSTSYCNKNPFTSSNINPQCRGYCDLQTNTCKDGVDIGGICIPSIPRSCNRGYCQSNLGVATCQPYKNNGEPCTENVQCSSTYCVNNGGAARTCQSNPADEAIRNAAAAFAIGYIIAIIISAICAISICIGIWICLCRSSRRAVIINNTAQPKLMVANVTYPSQQQQAVPLQPVYAAQQPQQQQQAYVSQQQPYVAQQQQQQPAYGTPQPIQGQPMMYAHTPQQQPMYLPQGQPMYAPGMYPQGQPMPMYGTTPQQPVQMYAPGQPVASQAYVAPPAYAPSSPSAPDAFPEVNKPDVEARPVSATPSGYQPLVESPNTTSQ